MPQYTYIIIIYFLGIVSEESNPGGINYLSMSENFPQYYFLESQNLKNQSIMIMKIGGRKNPFDNTVLHDILSTEH